MKVLLDTDLASAFAKVGQIELLSRLFAGRNLGIAFEVYKELLVPLDTATTFPRSFSQRVTPSTHSQRKWQLSSNAWLT